MPREALVMSSKLLYRLILLGMGANGFLYLAWLLSPPNPDRVGFWFFIYFLVFPYLVILGIVALLLKNSLNIPASIGLVLLFYVGVLTFLANSYQLGLSWMWTWLSAWGGYEFFHMLLFVLALVWLIVRMQRPRR